MSDYYPGPIPSHVKLALRKGRAAAKRKAHSVQRVCSEATWWVYYLTDEGKTVYITAIPLPLKRAQGHQRAAQRYYRGRHVIQVTETPPNDAISRPIALKPLNDNEEIRKDDAG